MRSTLGTCQERFGQKVGQESRGVLPRWTCISSVKQSKVLFPNKVAEANSPGHSAGSLVCRNDEANPFVPHKPSKNNNLELHYDRNLPNRRGLRDEFVQEKQWRSSLGVSRPMSKASQSCHRRKKLSHCG
ncbi:PREDICTED: uncharacterized protein LOC109243054 [Nicotiana attenuata]|uniref:uncharacterized protein LOC109243054 n=1 Tax=Nicotiana attenuata TaxID=49451 RepID=UPI0009059E07|nr:PREDICTED: uncharacterized protein LOC109243054 [Nicotiana attenuata]